MTFTKEQLIARAETVLSNARTAADFHDSKPYHLMDIHLAEIALASLEAEPVSFDELRDAVAEVSGGPAMEWRDTYKGHQPVPFINFNSLARIVDKFCTAPPAPVSVPDDVTGPLEYAYKELTTVFMRNHITAFERYGIYPDGSAAIQAMRIALDGMERRASMLQGADGNSPAIPDGWVACSEWMPEATGDIIVVSDGIVMSGVSYSRKKGFYLQALEYDADESVDDVTHWMPLPAAPKQEAE